MSIFNRTIYIILIFASILSGCSFLDKGWVAFQSAPAGSESPSQPASSAASSGSPSGAAEPQPEQQAGPSYIDELTQQTIAKFVQPDMGEYEKAKAAFDYIIETATLTDPIGLELWRIRGDNGPQPSFVENRSLSILLFDIGMCEDYAAALTMLLRGMGLGAQYVPGLTYAANGTGFVDHAWVIAKIDGVWYHLDVQLEQNVSKRETVRYRYFMKGDAYMSGSHRWGQNLIDSRLLTPGQNDEIARDFLHPQCPEDYPTPPPHTFTPAPKPDVPALLSAIDAEVREYERVHGPLEPLELNIIPPVFGLEGYGETQ